MDIADNYFALFGLEPGFDIDMALLAASYRKLQLAAHPDRHASSGERDQRLAVQAAGYINEAYGCLSSPVKRAAYLLELAGVDTGKHTTSDNVFLMQQIDWREQLQAIPSQPAPLALIANFRRQIREGLESLQTDFASQYACKDYTSAAGTLYRMQFMQKLDIEADQLEGKLLDQ